MGAARCQDRVTVPFRCLMAATAFPPRGMNICNVVLVGIYAFVSTSVTLQPGIYFIMYAIDALKIHLYKYWENGKVPQLN